MFAAKSMIFEVIFGKDWRARKQKSADQNGSKLSSSTSEVGASRKGRSSSTPRLKRSSSHVDASLSPSKRSCSGSPTKANSNAQTNQVYRRLILHDCGKPIYKASSRVSLIAALEGCIRGHKSLRNAGLLYRDISMHNVMMNEAENNPSWPSFLIDLDLAVKEQREGASRARSDWHEGVRGHRVTSMRVAFFYT